MTENLRYLVSEMRLSERTAGEWRERRHIAMNSARCASTQYLVKGWASGARDCNRWVVMHKRHATGFQEQIFNTIKGENP